MAWKLSSDMPPLLKRIRNGHLFSDVAALQLALIEREPSDFVSHFIFEPIPFLFEGDLGLWISWKTALGRKIEVDPHDIVLTGSSALGFSLSPYKNFKEFNEASDIDCGIISSYHFDVAWRHLRKLRPSWLSLPGASRRAIEVHRKNYVFAGTIATDSILGILPFGIEWQKALEGMSEIAPTTGRNVKLRIYKDYEALRQYQAHNIANLRNDLLENSVQGDEILLED